MVTYNYAIFEQKICKARHDVARASVNGDDRAHARAWEFLQGLYDIRRREYVLSPPANVYKLKRF